MLARLLVCLCLPAGCNLATSARSDPVSCPEIAEISIVSIVGEEGKADGRRKYVKAGEPVTLYAVVKVKTEGADVVYSQAPGIKRAHAPAEWPAACPVTLAWSKVEAKVESYNNAYSAPPSTISYAETEWKSGWSVPADVHPTLMHDDFADVGHGLGTMRYKLTATTAAQTLATEGTECRESGAVCRRVHTVAYRKDNSYLGYLHELFNCPYIYGSKRIKGGHQSDVLVGSDCADFAVYGKRRQRGKKKFGYTYTGGLYKLAKRRWKVSLDDEQFYVDKKKRRLTFGDGETIRPGDLINFEGGHVGVLVKDDGDGYLDTGDLIMHTLFREPEIVSIDDCRWGQVNGKEVLRLKD